MNRLNKARVSLKHYGIMPAQLEIEAFRASTTEFLNENTQLLFGVDFNTVSLVDFISYTETKRLLSEASEFMKNNQLIEAMGKIAISFSTLFVECQDVLRDRYGRMKFAKRDIGPPRRNRNDPSSEAFMRGIVDSLNANSAAIEILGLGFDFRRYRQFVNLTPTVSGGRVYRQSDPTPTMDRCRFCFDFVVESAIKLQEDRAVPPVTES
jgi:hypothetical protein